MSLWLSCFERSNMFSNWTFLSVVLSSVLVHISLASNSPHGCNAPLGLQDRKVSDSQLSSPHYYENFYVGYGKTLHTKPECARLYNGCAWCAAGRRGYYIEVDLKKNTTITGIATQGFPGLSDYYVKTYRVVYSSDGREWQQFRTSSSGNAREKIWPGNSDTQTVVENIFPSPISTRFVRVFPVSYNYEICMRMELYGCRNDTLDKTTTVTSTTPTTLTTPVPTVSKRQRTSTSSAMPSLHETTTSSQGSDTTEEKVTIASERQKISTTSPNIPSPHLTAPSSQGSQFKDPSPHKNSPTVPTEKKDSHEDENARVGEYRSARNTLVIGLIVGVAFLFICSVPVVMFLLFKCHERQKSYISKYQVNDDVYHGIPLTSVVYDAGFCKQELDEYKYPAFEEYSSDLGHHGPCPV